VRTPLLWAAGAVVLGVAACGGVETLSYRAPPAPPPALPSSPPTTLADTEGVVLPAVGGVTTTTAVAVFGGAATISGTVSGPSGPVGEATVQATRYVDGRAATTVAVTRPDGSFALSGVRGGAYRLTAWKPPALDLAVPLALFVAAAGDHPVALQLTSYAQPAVAAVFDPAAPVIGRPAAVAVQVTQPTVGPGGVIAYRPVPGASVQVVDGPNWLVWGPNPATTGAGGEADFQLTCTAAGPQGLEATVNGGHPRPLAPPVCVEPPPPATVLPPPPTTAPSSSTTTTTTTTPPTTAATTTTSTTRPPPTGG
jgi:hypothetical protein